MYKISVIIPVYNREKTIKKCLTSLLEQNIKEIEILVIDDGSTDNSANIIKEYQNKFPDKINYIYKENTGVADTRNFGIKTAQGEYILFVDSDDYIEFDLFKQVEKYMEEEYDLIKIKLRKVDNNRKRDRENKWSNI